MTSPSSNRMTSRLLVIDLIGSVCLVIACVLFSGEGRGLLHHFHGVT